MKINVGLTKLLEWIIVVSMLVILLSNFVNVILRYFFSAPFYWTDELSALLFVWIIFIGSAVAVATNSHASLDYFFRKMTPQFKKITKIVYTIIIIVTLLYLTIGSYNWIEVLSDQKYSSLPLPLALGFLPIPIGCALMIYFLIVNLIKDFKK
ncbi:TRAP transporter small permease [Priestia megaterium]|uniref:TRAP transporter small permease n=1 Tax=Priestia megaterium TaxID=1404 RepID=UPI002A6A62AC|nr:TRAP transporter small permease [Priestia megaterium]MDY0943820.1 TRAP transporter small permease [Priestia megaterium]